ncbi:MAG: class I SAM-dependent methyltransferase [Candidatus Brocadiia bacterium]
MDEQIKVEEVIKFWDNNPLCASVIPYALGTKEYFNYYDKLRELNGSIDFHEKLHEYRDFAGKKVLDVGSGNGYVLSHYAKAGAEVFGIDLSQTAIDLCRKRFEIAGLKGNFQVANAENMPFDDETFDCVCSMGVLHHTPDTKQAISEVYRVMKKNGRLILMFYHKNSALYWVGIHLQAIIKMKSIRQLINEVDGVGNPKGAVYTKKNLRQLLVRFNNLNIFVGLLQGWMIMPGLGRFLPDSWLKSLAGRYGWFLYAKGYK